MPACNGSPRCPTFKILTYYGSAKQRKNLRTGWSKLNSFHVCITSYQLVVQDAVSFRRKRWYYMILDEAHNIKVKPYIVTTSVFEILTLLLCGSEIL